MSHDCCTIAINLYVYTSVLSHFAIVVKRTGGGQIYLQIVSYSFSSHQRGSTEFCGLTFSLCIALAIYMLSLKYNPLSLNTSDSNFLINSMAHHVKLRFC